MAKAQKQLEGAVMTDQGLKYNGFILEPVVEKCSGCERTQTVEGQTYCTSYAQPARKWDHGACNFATHVKASYDQEGKVKINPIKASKRAARKR